MDRDGRAGPVDGGLDADRLLALAWPSGVPGDERRLLESLTLDRRDRVLRRLAAVLSGDGAVADRAAVAGDERTVFFRLRGRWAEERSLRSLIPYLDHSPRRRARRPDVEEEAERQIALHPRATRERIVAHVREAVDAPPGLSTLRRIVGEVSRRRVLASEDLRERFGRAYALEYVTTDVPLATPSGPQWADAAFLFERSTGLVLGSWIGPCGDGPEIVRLAAAAAAAGRSGVTPVATSDPDDAGLAVRFPPPGAGTAAAAILLHGDLSGALGADAVLDGGSDFGGMMAAPIGFRLGPIRLEPRRTADVAGRDVATAEGGATPSFDAAGALRRLDRALEEHNAPLAERLGGMGLVSSGAAAGRLAELTRWARRSVPT